MHAGLQKPATSMARMFKQFLTTTLAATALSLAAAPLALADTGKLVLTGGVTSIDGAAGGGITPWAVIGTQATQGQWGASATASLVRTRDFGLDVAGAAVSYNDRIEFSLARQRFDTGPTGDALGLPGLRLNLDIVGAKLRVAGDAILDSDTWQPQIAVGVLHKRLHAGGLEPTLDALGAARSGSELYLSATKLLLAQGLLVNGTLRATKANQNGLLGFGSASRDAMRVMPELSAAWLLRRDLAIGAEWRSKPDNLNNLLGPGVLKEDRWADLFVAWAPGKNVSVTAAWLDLGHITPPFVQRRQTGAYVSLQVAL
jgi:Protein of unknown function (DUF3034)